MADAPSEACERVCGKPGCDAPHLARGFCNRHYLQWRNGGGQTGARPPLWTPEMDAALLGIELTPHTERYRGSGAFAAIAKRLGKTPQACVARYNRLMRQQGHNGGQWTEEGLWTAAEDRQIARIVEEHPGRVPMGTWPDVARVLGRTVGAVRLRAWKLRKGLAGA